MDGVALWVMPCIATPNSKEAAGSNPPPPIFVGVEGVWVQTLNMGET